MKAIFILLVIYQLKHFLADYPLQGRYMLGKFLDRGWVKPLLAHVAVHGAMTFVIATLFLGLACHPWVILGVTFLDAGIHFAMDRLKAGKKYLGRFKPLTAEQYIKHASTLEPGPRLYFIKPEEVLEATKAIRGNMFFWWSLGLDQMVHHLTHYACIWILIAAR